MPKQNLVGLTFGRLTVIRFSGYPAHAPSKATWHCVCSCGVQLVVYGYNLKNGNTESCGCFKIEATKLANSTHRKSKTRLYGVYCCILSRCYNVNDRRYLSYGGRGIYVCDRWLGKGGFENFLIDMGPRPTKYSVERQDNDGSYSPENCVWADHKTQSNNKRTNTVFTYRGETLTVTQLCEKYELPVGRIFARLRIGFSIDDAITAPLNVRRRTWQAGREKNGYG